MPRRHRRDAEPTVRRRGQGPAPPLDVAEIANRLRGPSWATTEGFEVKRTVGSKRYRCPYCEGWIEPDTQHVVAFEVGRPEDRRHYHSPCWARQAAGKR